MGEQAVRSLQTDLAAVCGHVNAQHAQLVRLTERALSERTWAQIGILSPSHWLAWKAGLATGTARKIVATARRAHLHPQVMAAFEAGELSLDQAASAVRAPGYTDSDITSLAKVMTVTQLSRVVRRYPFRPDPAVGVVPAEPDSSGEPAVAEPEPATSTLSMYVDDDGVGQVRAALAPDHFAVFDTAMREARDALFHNGDTKVNWADALVELANRSLDTVPERSRRDRFRVNLYVHTNGSTTFADNRWVPAALRHLLTCDTDLTPIYVNDDGVPVNVGRSQHIVPDRTRRLVEHRDLGCRVPGCEQSRWMHIHHIIHWNDGGTTDTWNLICLCPKHHRMHHHGKLGISGNADLPPGTPGAVELTDERGRTIPPGAAATAPGAPAPAPTGRYRHPLGERLDYSAVYFHPPRPTDAERN